MSEMLANQYFMARNYLEAKSALLDCLESAPKEKHIIKKLIICCTQTGEISEALNLFYQLVKEDIEFIINTNPVEDDCPCIELIDQMENSNQIASESYEYFLIRGMIWLYCDAKKSLQFFKEAARLNNEDPKLQFIQKRIINYLNQEGFI